MRFGHTPDPSSCRAARALLFTIGYTGRGPDGARIAVLALETGAKTVLLTGRHAKYLRSGRLVYGTEGTLRAVVFDLEQRTVVGAPVPVLAPVAVRSFQGAYGAQAWLTMGRSCICRRTSRPRPHARSCGSIGSVARRRSAPKLTRTVHPRLAPDGTRVAVLNALNIWIWDLARARLTAVTLDGGSISIWTPDSSRIIFSSMRGGGSPISTPRRPTAPGRPRG